MSDIIKQAYATYLDQLMRGATPIEAAKRARIKADCIDDFIRDAEVDPLFVEMRDATFKRLEPRKMWTPGLAVLQLVRLATNENERGMTRVAAIKELNVMLGYVELPEDDGAKRKSGRSLADFYADVAGSGAVPGVQHDVQRH